jgi:hypothetical protein
LRSSGHAREAGGFGGNRRIFRPLSLGGTQKGVCAMKYIPVAALGLALVASVTACEYKEERTVQQPPATAAVVATPAPPGSVVYAPPAPATTTTTVYTSP